MGSELDKIMKELGAVRVPKIELSVGEQRLLGELYDMQRRSLKTDITLGIPSPEYAPRAY